MTKKETKEAFLKDLEVLLKKYKAQIRQEEYNRRPYSCSSYSIFVNFEGSLSEDYEVIEPTCELDLVTQVDFEDNLLEKYKKELDKE